MTSKEYFIKKVQSTANQNIFINIELYNVKFASGIQISKARKEKKINYMSKK